MCPAGVDASALGWWGWGSGGNGQNLGWWASCSPSSLWSIPFLSLCLLHCLFSISGIQILMIRYPSSQLGEMSLEEHSQCECRCQPGPTSELTETRLGGCRA